MNEKLCKLYDIALNFPPKTAVNVSMLLMANCEIKIHKNKT